MNPYFKDLERIGQQIPELLESHRLRGAVDGLPVPDMMILKGLPAHEVVVAARIYAFLASAYVHQIGEPAAAILPKCGAIPFFML